MRRVPIGIDVCSVHFSLCFGPLSKKDACLYFYTIFYHHSKANEGTRCCQTSPSRSLIDFGRLLAPAHHFTDDPQPGLNSLRYYLPLCPFYW
jgi:hypothetical protein